MKPSEQVKTELIGVLPRLQRYARNLTTNYSDADDLLQATSERVLSRWEQFQPGTDFDRWAFTIMHSIRSNYLRAETVRRGNGVEDATENLLAPENQSPERNKNFEQVLERVIALPVAQRQVLLLVYVEGFSYKAAASILGVPIGTVMSRIARARMKLASELVANDPISTEAYSAESATAGGPVISQASDNLSDTRQRNATPVSSEHALAKQTNETHSAATSSYTQAPPVFQPRVKL